VRVADYWLLCLHLLLQATAKKDIVSITGIVHPVTGL